MATSGQLVTTAQALPARRRARYGPFARWLMHMLFDTVPFPEDGVAPLQKLAQEATLVYVLRSSSLLHLLYFNWMFYRHRLPLARAATGLGIRIFGPFARWYLGGRQVRAKGGGEVAHVVEAVRRGEAAMVFLRAPRTLSSAVTTLPDPFPALVELQRNQARPVRFVVEFSQIESRALDEQPRSFARIQRTATAHGNNPVAIIIPKGSSSFAHVVFNRVRMHS